MSRTLLEAYRRALDAGGSMVREDAACCPGMSELEWQARWFSGDYGRRWTAADGAEIHLEDFGRWNREPGPDFVDARVRIGTRHLRGAVELDLDARDWERHQHATNPSFRETVLHVFMHAPSRRFFTRTCDHREVAQLHLPVAARTPGRDFPGQPGLPCEDERFTAIVLAAARHRLELKARSLLRHAAVHGEDEAWFAALSVALGYKHNQTPFLLLAQRVGLRSESDSRGEAQLFGTAGFLESPLPVAADRSVRGYLRDLWERWWTMRAACERLIIPGAAWRSGGARPANHPQRRVAALARIAAGWGPVRKALKTKDAHALTAALRGLDHPFWATRFNLQAGVLDRPQALVGAERIRDILINIHHPLAVAGDDAAWIDFLSEKGPTPAGIMRTTARRLFGAAADSSALLSSAAIQQGLLQLEKDYRAAPEPAEFLEALRRVPAGSTDSSIPC